MSCTLLTFNCNKSPTEPEIGNLVNRLWTLEAFEIENNIVKSPKDQLYTVQFKKNGSFLGINDCNDFGGEYEVKTDNAIIIHSVGGSKVYCLNSMFLEYLEGFRTAKSYEIHKNMLYIYYGNNSRLIFYGD